jgi:hypothetical protein
MKQTGPEEKQEHTGAHKAKRPFVAPKLIRHGSLSEITRQGGSLVTGASFF